MTRDSFFVCYFCSPSLSLVTANTVPSFSVPSFFCVHWKGYRRRVEKAKRCVSAALGWFMGGDLCRRFFVCAGRPSVNRIFVVCTYCCSVVQSGFIRAYKHPIRARLVYIQKSFAIQRIEMIYFYRKHTLTPCCSFFVPHRTTCLLVVGSGSLSLSLSLTCGNFFSDEKATIRKQARVLYQ